MCQTYFFPCKSIKSEKLPFQLFLTTLKIALAASTLWQYSCKRDFHRKIFVVESTNITIQTSWYTNENWKLKQFNVYLTVEVFLHARNTYLNVRNTFLTFERRKQCDNLTSKIMWYKICRRYASILIYPLCGFNKPNSSKRDKLLIKFCSAFIQCQL